MKRFCGYVFPGSAGEQTHIIVHYEIVQHLDPAVITGEIVPFGCNLFQKVELSAGNSREVMMFNMIPNIIANVIHGPIIRVGCLTWNELEMLCNKMSTDRV